MPRIAALLTAVSLLGACVTNPVNVDTAPVAVQQATAGNDYRPYVLPFAIVLGLFALARIEDR